MCCLDPDVRVPLYICCRDFRLPSSGKVVHASAVEKNPSTYEHIDPELVGNSRNVIISDQSGKSNILNQLGKMSIDLTEDQITNILRIIKQKEFEGFSYDTALASFEILVRKELGQINDYYLLQKFRVTDKTRKILFLEGVAG